MCSSCSSHALLGFTSEGGHLISLHKEDADDQLDELEALGLPAEPVATFGVHWWALPATGTQLRHVCCASVHVVCGVVQSGALSCVETILREFLLPSPAGA